MVDSTMVEKDETESGVALKPVPGLWFDNDRMIVLQAGTKEFRVPRCILTARSRIFKEFLQLSDEIQYYQLSEPADYTEYFLRAIYDSGYFECPPKVCQLDHVLGILSMSTKYEVDYLKRRSLSHLASGFPLTLDGWRLRLQTSTFQPTTEYSLLYAHSNIPKTLSVLKALNKARAVWLLPAAFYECCRYDLKDLLKNPAWMDGSLEEGLKNVILVGYNRQLQEGQRILRFLHKPTDVNCLNPPACMEVRRGHAHECFDTWSMNNPFGIWDDGDWLLLDDLCGPCLEAAKTIHAQDCSDLWQRLPALYDLPPWEALIDLKNSAML